MAKKIVCTPRTCGGEPRIEGHRLTCANVVLSLEHESLSSYLSDYPELSVEDIKACLSYCAKQQCIEDQPESFCFRCVLDTSNSDDLDNEEPVRIWEISKNLLSNFDSLLENSHNL